jgi:type III pantothenate kinase
MLLVVDIGNTRTKWAAVNEDGTLNTVQVCTNANLATSKLKRSFAGIEKMLVANVAGDDIAEMVTKLAPKRVQVEFVSSQAKACGVINKYKPIEALGVDRWAALIAAWKIKKQPCIVVNAGTAVTIDALAKDKTSKSGLFIGGTIMPGLHLMHAALKENGAQLDSEAEGEVVKFPTNTQDAIATGNMNAILGAIVLLLKQLEKHSAYLPKIIVSGGDAKIIAEALKPHMKHVIIEESLVLQGLILLEEEAV